jgi:anti-sigma factor ChrR (cupin superfamily)
LVLGDLVVKIENSEIFLEDMNMFNSATFSDIQNALTKTQEMKWVEMSPGETWAKVLFTSKETGAWGVLYKWRKGYVAAPHKHLSGAHIFILKGKLEYRGGILGVGDYGFESNGALHGATTTLEDCEFLFFCNGPILILESEDSEKPLGCFTWEHIAAVAESAQVV